MKDKINSAIFETACVAYNKLRVKADTITYDMSLSDDLGLDSIDLVELAMLLELVTGFDEVDADAVEQWSTVQDIYDYFGVDNVRAD